MIPKANLFDLLRKVLLLHEFVPKNCVVLSFLIKAVSYVEKTKCVNKCRLYFLVKIGDYWLSVWNSRRES